MLTRDKLARAVGCSTEMAAEWLPVLKETATRFSLDTMKRMAAFLAQTGHESAGFTRLVENLNYSAQGLRNIFPKYFADLEAAEAYARKPEAIASRVYANRMGNGDEASRDGWTFRGRGLIQVTGKTNYAACGNALGVDLLRLPDSLAKPRFAALSAGWYWESRGLNSIADLTDIETLTKRINGGLHGLADRIARWERAKEALCD